MAPHAYAIISADDWFQAASSSWQGFMKIMILWASQGAFSRHDLHDLPSAMMPNEGASRYSKRISWEKRCGDMRC